jgi:hypothetical protein
LPGLALARVSGMLISDHADLEGFAVQVYKSECNAVPTGLSRVAQWLSGVKMADATDPQRQ